MGSCNSCPSKGTCGKQAGSCDIQNNEHNKICHVIGAMSGKDDAGKSSTSVLVVKGIARRGFRADIMDADVMGPSIPYLTGLEYTQVFGTSGATEPAMDKDGTKAMFLNFLMEDENQSVAWCDPTAANVVKQSWTDVTWEELGHLFIDMPPGADDVALTVLQNLPASGVIMVLTLQPTVSMVASKAINMCKQVKVEALGITENMSYVVCLNCDRRIEIFQHRNVEDFTRENEMLLWAELPMMGNTSGVHKDDDFDTETTQQIYAWISLAVDQLIEKMSKQIYKKER